MHTFIAMYLYIAKFINVLYIYVGANVCTHVCLHKPFSERWEPQHPERTSVLLCPDGGP